MGLVSRAFSDTDEFAEQPPRATRRKVHLYGELHDAKGQERVLVHNISVTGAFLQGHTQRRCGECVVLTLPEFGARKVEIVWSVPGLSGCAFTEPLSKADFARAVLASGDPAAPLATGGTAYSRVVALAAAVAVYAASFAIILRCAQQVLLG